jgi:hypothetical protein
MRKPEHALKSHESGWMEKVVKIFVFLTCRSLLSRGDGRFLQESEVSFVFRRSSISL